MRRLLAAAVCLLGVSACTTSGAVQITPQALPTPAVTASYQQLALDTDTGGCIGSPDDKLAVLEIPNGASFHSVFPRGGGTPELEGVKVPLWVVIYKDGWPGPTLGLPHRASDGTSKGVWDVCVQRTDGTAIEGLPLIVYGAVPQEDAAMDAP